MNYIDYRKLRYILRMSQRSRNPRVRIEFDGVRGGHITLGNIFTLRPRRIFPIYINRAIVATVVNNDHCAHRKTLRVRYIMQTTNWI